MKKEKLTAHDYQGIESNEGSKDVKTFEICLEQEPTQDEISAFRNQAGQWQGLKVIKLRPANIHNEKASNGKFWTLSFIVHQDDWLFWCGFCAGKNWFVAYQNKLGWKKKRQAEIGEWTVQI